MNQKIKFLSALVICLLCQSTQAFETTYFTFRLGYPSLSLALDPRLQPDLGATNYLGFEMFRTIEDLPIAVGIMTQIFQGGSFGGFPLLQSGVPIYYFPFSRPDASYAVDSDLVVKTSSWTPYLKFVPGYEFMNLHNSALGAEFGSSCMMYILGGGLILPLVDQSKWGFEIGYTGSIGATDNSKSPIALSGYLFSINYHYDLH